MGYAWAATATWDGTEAQRGLTGRIGTSSFVFLSFLVSSFILIILLLFRLPLFGGVQQRAGRTGPMATRDGTGEQTGMTGTSSVTVFSLFSSFLLLTFAISFVANYSNRRGWSKWDGKGRDDAGSDRTGRGAGGREEEVGERGEGGLAGNMDAEAEGQVTKGRKWELRGADDSGRRVGWAGKQARAEAGQHGCYPASALAVWSRRGHFFSKSNAVK